MPIKQNLVLKKTWLLCHKIWLSRQTNKNRLPCHKTKFGSHATKSLASMPQNQNLAFTPQKSALMPKTGFHATKPKLGFHATKIGFHAKQNFGFHAIQNSAFKPSQKSGILPQNLAFKSKNNHLTKDFHKMTTF